MSDIVPKNSGTSSTSNTSGTSQANSKIWQKRRNMIQWKDDMTKELTQSVVVVVVAIVWVCRFDS